MLKNKFSKYLIFISIFIFISLVIAIVSLLTIDLYVHHKLEKQQGYNYRGYRGRVLSAKEKDEYRIACFGGSIVYGYYINNEDTWPYLLEKEFEKEKAKISVANLGFNGQGIYGIYHDITYYDYLDYDLAIIYNAGIDQDPSNMPLANGRGGDYIFEKFGYKLILPIYLYEKSLILKYGIKNLEKVYSGNGDEKQASKDNPIKFQLGASLNQMREVYLAINKKFASFEEQAAQMNKKNLKPYEQYIEYLIKTFDRLLQKNKKIIYICGLDKGMADSLQQKLVRKLINERYLNKVKYIDLSPIIDIKNKSFAFDGMHLSREGNEIIAKNIKLLLKNDLKL